MRIDQPTVVTDGRHVTLQANVHLVGGRPGPATLWFRYPASCEPLLYTGVEPFVVALSSRGSMNNEPIEVDLPIWEHLHANLEEYWLIFNRWRPDGFHPITLATDGFCQEPQFGRHTGTAFSGGVDSFFTLFRHSGERETHESLRIAYGIFVHGFDIPLVDERTYEVAASAYEEALGGLGVRLVRVATNLRDFLGNWEFTHGSALCGTALTLAGALRRFFVPSSKSYSTLEPWGSDPLTDPLLSSEGFRAIHDGAAFTRFDKIKAMQHWPLIRPLLRTCWERPDGLRNCGQCTNCRRTMMVLASLGELESFETFPRLTSPWSYARCSWRTPHERLFGRQAIECATAKARGIQLRGAGGRSHRDNRQRFPY